MDIQTSQTLLFTFISSIFYVIPSAWIKDYNPITAGIATIASLIFMMLYAVNYHDHTFASLTSDTVLRNIFFGLLYAISSVAYFEGIKYGKIHLLSSQSIIIFILSSVISFYVLGEAVNMYKIIGIILSTIGVLFVIFGSFEH